MFTKVLDEMPRGLVAEDEEAAATPTDRAYWERRASVAALAIVASLFELAKQLDSKLELTYKKHYIGLSRDGAPLNFVIFQPTRSTVTLAIGLTSSVDVDEKIEHSHLEQLAYDAHFGRYWLRLSAGDLADKTPVLRELLQLAYDRRST